MSGIMDHMVINVTDLEMLIFFLLVWCGYTYAADHSRLKEFSISHAMDRQRLRWLTEAATRDVKIVDTNVISILVTGISFFASTTVLVIGGLIAALSYADELSPTLSNLPFVSPMSAGGLSVRFGFLLAIFIYAFFKFSWSYRTANYCAVIVGGMSDSRYDENEKDRHERIAVAAQLSSTSGNNYNRGLRAYFFALAGLGWFVNPVVFVVATILVICVLIRREFASNSVKSLRGLQ